ncbi:ubiquitin-like protein 7 [Danaus plexippus]|uniref:ubiquitin-like protein 7 n=1 Tax=Danaus plexippus TaxID=13037 RepID=UPI002AB0DDED|nr:ubiquitin-like protein 7 [Danaus plexippus]
MEAMESQPCVFLGIKVKSGPIERFKLENFTLDNTIDKLRDQAEKKTGLPSSSLELIHHGKILKESTSLMDSGIKNGEMIHVVKKKVVLPPPPPPTYPDSALQQLNISLRTLGCTPNAPGWTRAMQLLNEESAISEIIDHAPSLADDCMTISILHEVELLAALGANLQTMRRGADAHPELPNALRHLLRLTNSQSKSAAPDSAPTSGFAYSLEALSEDEDVEEEETEEGEERSGITPEQLASALQVATQALMSRPGRSRSVRGVLHMLHDQPTTTTTTATTTTTSEPTTAGGAITAEMFDEAIIRALRPMDNTSAASSSQSSGRDSDFTTQLSHMHEIGLLDDAINVRALIICAGDVNAAINLVFSGAIGDD